MSSRDEAGLISRRSVGEDVWTGADAQAARFDLAYGARLMQQRTGKIADRLQTMLQSH